MIGLTMLEGFITGMYFVVADTRHSLSTQYLSLSTLIGHSPFVVSRPQWTPSRECEIKNSTKIPYHKYIEMNKAFFDRG